MKNEGRQRALEFSEIIKAQTKEEKKKCSLDLSEFIKAQLKEEKKKCSFPLQKKKKKKSASPNQLSETDKKYIQALAGF